MKTILLKLIVWGVLGMIPLISFSQKNNRIKENFDFDWKFKLEDNSNAMKMAFDDSKWDDVQLPHDWSIGLKFDMSAGGSAGYLPGGIGSYRKTFMVPKTYKGSQVSVLFDGVYHQSEVYINSKKLGLRPYGFIGFEYDLTPYLKFGEKNVIAVRVDHTLASAARWYTGSGIYRHAWLQVVKPVHVATWGTYVTTPVVKEGSADVKIVTTIDNASEHVQTALVSQSIMNTNGKPVAQPKEQKVTLAAKGKTNIEQILQLANPKLWTLEEPTLYDMVTTIKVGSKVVDAYYTSFGVRTVKFDKDKGFFLNGKHIKLQGMCLHQDAGILGTAIPDRSYERRLQIIKEYGCNAIRCSHNPPSPEFLDMCDKMGFIVIDEAFDKWKAGNGYYQKLFDEWWQRDLGDMILRDRNHPSVVLWSIGNEVAESSGGVENDKRAAMLRDFVHQSEPTRPTILACQNGSSQDFADVTDLIGYNYLEARMLKDHQLYPNRIFMVTEELPFYSGEEGNIRSYTPLNPWNIVSANDFIGGGFIWPGVDYIGEAGWPSKGWPNGLFDICMFEKARASYHRAMWNSKPMVAIAVADQSLDIDHGRDLWQWPNIAAYWNFPQRYQGLVIQVQTVTNCERVELFLNGKSMGKKKTADFTNNTIVWYLPYTPGRLEAKAYNGNEEVAQSKLVTAKGADHIVVEPDRTEIKSDGQDLSHITISLVDVDGNPVSTDDKMMTVSIEGEGKLLGIDNGELRRSESFAGNKLPTYLGKALVIVQSTRKAGTMKVKVEMEGKEPVFVNILSKASSF